MKTDIKHLAAFAAVAIWADGEYDEAEKIALEEIADERADVAVGKIDVDAEPELASRFNVFSIPTLVYMKNGEIITQSAGARPKAAILAMLDNQ